MTPAMRYQTAVPTPSLARLDMQDKDNQLELFRKWASNAISKTEVKCQSVFEPNKFLLLFYILTTVLTTVLT